LHQYAVVGFGKFVKDCRERAGMTRPEFRKAMGGISEQTLSRWENDHSPPRKKNLMAMLKLANLTLDQCLRVPKGYEDIVEELSDAVTANIEARKSDVRNRGKPGKG
jgi:transcriptional regulator with XRE-family HTH domain